MNTKDITIVCSSCQTTYRMDHGKIQNDSIIRCAVCNHRFFVHFKKHPKEAALEDTISVDVDYGSQEKVGEEISAESAIKEESIAVDEAAETLTDFPTGVDDDISELNGVEFELEDLEVDEIPEESAISFDDEDAEIFDTEEGIEVDDETLRTEKLIDEAEEILVKTLEGAVPKNIQNLDLSKILSGEDDEDSTLVSQKLTVTDDVEETVKSADDSGMVEFFIEDEKGEINRIETTSGEENESAEGEVVPGPLRQPMNKFAASRKDAVDEESVSKSQPKPLMQKHQPPVVEVEKPEDELVRAVGTTTKAHPGFQSNKQRNFSKDKPQKTISGRDDSRGADSSQLVHLLVILAGIFGLLTNYFDTPPFQLDYVWSAAVIALGVFGFFMQRLSGLYIAGYFSLFYCVALLSRQVEPMAARQMEGLWNLGIILGCAVIFLASYHIIMMRKSDEFEEKTGAGQSVLSIMLGFIAILAAIYARAQTVSIPSVEQIMICGTAITEILSYVAVPLTVIIQSAIASLAIAFGLSSFRVQNGKKMFAVLGILFGIA